MFEEELFSDLETTVFPYPNALLGVNGSPGQAGPDVVVLYDWVGAGWPEPERQSMQKYLDSGKGLFSIHHAMDDNGRVWPWWREQVLGVAQFQGDVEGMKTSARLKMWSRQKIRPVGNHPIVRDMEPFELPWTGINSKSRVVCVQPGSARGTHKNRYYRRLVRNSIL